MSTKRGNVKKSGPPKHQNKTAYKNDLHNKSQRMKIINSLDIGGLCARCTEKIEYKIKYNKYKQRTQPGTCVKCAEKNVLRSYYKVCQPCAERLEICAFCAEQKKIVKQLGLSEAEEEKMRARKEQELKLLSERKRRALLRDMDAGGDFKEEGGEEASAAGGHEDGGEEEEINSDLSSDDNEDDCEEEEEHNEEEQEAKGHEQEKT